MIVGKPNGHELAQSPPISIASVRRRHLRSVTRPRAHHVHLNPEHRYGLVDLGWVRGNRLSGGAKTTLAVLSSRAHQEQGTCFPSLDTIAREAGYSVRSVQYFLRELTEAGAIRVELPPRGKRWPSSYSVLPAPRCEEVLFGDARPSR